MALVPQWKTDWRGAQLIGSGGQKMMLVQVRMGDVPGGSGCVQTKAQSCQINSHFFGAHYSGIQAGRAGTTVSASPRLIWGALISSTGTKCLWPSIAMRCPWCWNVQMVPCFPCVAPWCSWPLPLPLHVTHQFLPPWLGLLPLGGPRQFELLYDAYFNRGRKQNLPDQLSSSPGTSPA